ncbi:hypothetical protein BV25DRAFT_1907092 [Artomyces pyxidatus]|uniref:Uncharacterized protein n=1 Tax=Artomyces pyxidatus TaxID=48021 RepID=A0ACB8T3H4_9AGAM|nr:hypothetical protein BV25DRAFT_1907092 [Artomyces pyxidatus]
MKLSILFLFVLGAQASWFGSDTPAYQNWDTQQLTAWLKEHNIPTPSDAPSQQQLQELVKSNWASAQQYSAEQYKAAQDYGSDQYNAAQKTFQNLKDYAFETWDESTLRQFLLDQGVVAPKGPREQLVQLARQKHADWQKTASSLSYVASTGVYGSPSYQASQSVSSVIAQATADVSRKLDDSKDYVYSTWDDNRLRSFLEEKGLIKTKQQVQREEMLQLMHSYYAKVADPVYEAWSDSYMYEWLAAHNLSPSTSSTPPPRTTLLERMKSYYYDVTQKVWNTWSESDMKNWLVEHNIVKSNAQISREKLQKLVADNYLNAEDTIWSSWRDSDIREWLVEHDYVKGDDASKLSREQLVKMINAKYNDVSARTAPYLVWPDARLRAYLRENGLSEDALPTSRPGLLQEARIRYTQTTTRAEALYQRILDALNSGIHIAEDKLWAVLEILTGTKERAAEKAQSAKEWSNEKGKEARASVVSATAEASGKAVKSEL